MGKWREDFLAQYNERGTAKRLTKEVKDAIDKKRSQKAIDQTLTEVIKGKHQRRLLR